MENMKVIELRTLAKERGFTGISKLKKAELVELLREPEIEEVFLQEIDNEVEVIQYKDGDDWLETRKLGIGGSDVAGILGESKYKSAVDVWVDKAQGSDFKGNKFTYWGQRLENVVAEEFGTQHKEYQVKELNRTLKRGRSLANIDRLLHHPEKGYGVLECKTTSAFNNKAWNDDTVPQEYYCQVMHYLAVTGLKYAYIVCLIGGQDYKEFYIERNEEECQFLLEHCNWWWNEYVETETPPPADGSDKYSEYQKTKLGNLEDLEIEIEDLDNEVEKYNSLQSEIKAKEKEAELIKQHLLNKMIEAGGSKSKTENHKITVVTQNRSSVDKKAFEKTYPELVNQYKEKESEFKTNKETKFLKIS